MKYYFLLYVIVITVTFSMGQEELPYRDEETYEIKLDYNFKSRPFPEKDKIDYNHGGAFPNASLLPYLSINVHMKSIDSEEVKVRIINNKGHMSSSQKLKVEKPITIEMGFTEDMKEKLTPHAYTLIFLTKKRVQINRITFEVQDDGTFLVNGVKNGKF